MSLWKSHGTPTIWERICAAKHAVVEPSNKAEFHQAFGEFNAALGLQTGRLDGKFVDPEDGAVARTGEVARHKGGAVFFAVVGTGDPLESRSRNATLLRSNSSPTVQKQLRDNGRRPTRRAEL